MGDATNQKEDKGTGNNVSFDTHFTERKRVGNRPRALWPEGFAKSGGDNPVAYPGWFPVRFFKVRSISGPGIIAESFRPDRNRQSKRIHSFLQPRVIKLVG
jgi:hypothetical protein